MSALLGHTVYGMVAVEPQPRYELRCECGEWQWAGTAVQAGADQAMAHLTWVVRCGVKPLDEPHDPRAPGVW